MAEYGHYVGQWLVCKYIKKRFKDNTKSLYQCMVDSVEWGVKDGRVDRFGYPEMYSYLAQAKHYQTSHCVYLLNENLARSIYHFKMDDVRPSELKIPFSTFEICFPKGFLIPETNTLMPSFLCSIIHPRMNKDFEKRFTEDLCKKIGINLDFCFTGEENNFFILTYFSKPNFHKSDVDLNTCTSNSGTFAASLAKFGLDKLSDKYKNIDEYINNNPENKIRDFSSRSKDEVNMIFASIKYTWTTLCYLNLDHHESELARDQNRPNAGGVKPKIHLLGSSTPAHAFMRRGHIRCLRHERYRRNDDGSLRIIWVDEHMVNAQAQLIELKEEATPIEKVTLYGKDYVIKG